MTGKSKLFWLWWYYINVTAWLKRWYIVNTGMFNGYTYHLLLHDAIHESKSYLNRRKDSAN